MATVPHAFVVAVTCHIFVFSYLFPLLGGLEFKKKEISA
jgi:hypothetical protein